MWSDPYVTRDAHGMGCHSDLSALAWALSLAVLCPFVFKKKKSMSVSINISMGV